MSTYNDHQQLEKQDIQLKLLLPLAPLSLSSDTFISSSISRNYQSVQITSSRILYYSISPSLHTLSKDDPCVQLRHIQFPRAYALFLKDLSRLIKPTSVSSNLSIDLIWELMPDVDEHQRLLHDNKKYSFQQQQSLKIINNLIPEMWAEIGK